MRIADGVQLAVVPDGFHLVAAALPAGIALAGIFSRKSAASTDSISARHSDTSRSAESKLGGGQKEPSVEKKPYRSWRLAMLWQVSVRKAPLVERGVCKELVEIRNCRSNIQSILYRRMRRKSSVHQARDALHMRNEQRRRYGYVGDPVHGGRFASWIVLAAHKRPAVHLEMGQIGGGQHAAQLEQFGRFQLNGAPVVEVVLRERSVHAGQQSQLVAIIRNWVRIIFICFCP